MRYTVPIDELPIAEERRDADGRDAEKTAYGEKETGFVPDCVVVDPPRKGLDRDTISNVCDYAPERIVYVSCNPATLARDLVKFNEHGYFVSESAAFDMFPKTSHCEVVVSMSRVR